jgi:TPR repeat protein
LDIQENTADEWFHMGNSYFLKQEYEKAILYLGKAISLSPEDGMVIAVLGFCHEFGLGTPLSYTKAEEYYIQGCKLENGIALIRLAFLRYYGRPGVMINRVEAESLKKKANELPKESFEWLVIAAEKYNIPAAMYAYGVCFHDGYYIIDIVLEQKKMFTKPLNIILFLLKQVIHEVKVPLDFLMEKDLVLPKIIKKQFNIIYRLH